MIDLVSAITLSVKCSLLSAAVNLPWGIFWGWLLARKDFKCKILLQTLLYMPLFLPPVLTGYFLLVLFSRKGLLGGIFYDLFNWQFVLDWKGVVMAAAIVSSPFMIQMVKQAMEQVDARLEHVAYSLGASFSKTFFKVTLPLCYPGIIAGFFMVFVRSIGEFGATIIFAGNVPGKTQTIPLAIYHSVHLGHDVDLLPLVVATIVISYVGLGLSYLIMNTRPYK